MFTLKVGGSSSSPPPDREPPLPLTSLGNPPGPTAEEEEEEEEEEVDLPCAFLAETAPNEDRALLLLLPLLEPLLLLPAPPREELGAPGDRNGDHALDPPPYSRMKRGHGHGDGRWNSPFVFVCAQGLLAGR